MADAPFLVGADPPAAIPARAKPLREDGDFPGSLRWTIAAMMGSGAVSVAHVAAAAGTTPRTLQRRLAAYDLSFSDLLDETRREVALTLLTQSPLPAAEVAARLGYANASALTRAVRRWTGKTPRALRGSA